MIARDVVLHVPHQKTVAPASDGKFHIYIWSAPAGQLTENRPPQKIWGIKTDCRDNGFFFSGQGVNIVDTDTGWSVAELVGDNNLYVHYDLCHFGREGELSIFRRLCEEVAVEMTASPEKKAYRRRQFEEAQRAQSRDAYIKECSKRFEKTLEGTRSKIVETRKKIIDIQTSLVRAIREARGEERKLQQLEACRGGEQDAYGEEFDKLLAVPKVRRVDAREGKIVIHTDILFCVDPRTGKKHEIGAFCIELDTQRGAPRWTNLTRRVDGYKRNQMAPHIWENGDACLGNTAEVFPELIGNYEYAAAAMIAIQFVESVNTDDPAGKHIDRWPIVG